MRVRELPGACLELTLSVPSAGIYGVGKAAIHPPALAVLSYTPEEATQTIAWVGKGIVYDTGGLSIKGKVRCPWVEVWGWRWVQCSGGVSHCSGGESEPQGTYWKLGSGNKITGWGSERFR